MTHKYTDEEIIKLHGERLNMSMSYSPADDFADKTVTVEIEQARAGQDLAAITFVTGTAVFTLTMANAKTIDRLSNLFAEYAQKLRYCTKEQTT